MIAGVVSMVYGDDVNEQENFFANDSCTGCLSHGGPCDAVDVPGEST